MTTIEIESILGNEELAALLEAGEASGQLHQAELQEILEPLELDPLESDALYIELDRRGIEVLPDEPEKEVVASPPPPTFTQPVETTTDALQLFLREAGHEQEGGDDGGERQALHGRDDTPAGRSSFNLT